MASSYIYSYVHTFSSFLIIKFSSICKFNYNIIFSFISYFIFFSLINQTIFSN